MNAVEIEEAISLLVERPFDGDEFPYAFLEAFGNRAATIKRLRSGQTNRSDVGGVLQRNNVHLKVCQEGQVSATFQALKDSPETANAKVKFIISVDGKNMEAEDLVTGDIIATSYSELPDRFGFFLPLAGINKVSQISESSFDIKATRILNKMYVELLKVNPEWGGPEKRERMDNFLAQLIFCFFAEDTGIFPKSNMFTDTVRKMSDNVSSNTHEVIEEIFRSLNTRIDKRTISNIRRWADVFPYVNGGLFDDVEEIPKFSPPARSYLLHIGDLDWQKINPDIFGSMIQSLADSTERSQFGMHYTSVPNILRVLNPLFLDDLRDCLERAGDNNTKLINLQKRIAKIRIFDPACGSGNFLVIAYREMRKIEAEINRRRNLLDQKSDISIRNFRGLEIRSFPTMIARLALNISEYQCDVEYRGQRDAIREFLPLDDENWIECANALKINWSKICPPSGGGG